jgi:hypothetical protein
MTFEHPHRSAPHLIDIFDLPGRVVQERNRGILKEEIVMIGRAPEKGGDAPNFVAHLEPDAVDEEALRGLGVRSADDDVSQFARLDRTFAQDPRGTIILSVATTGRVGQRDRCRYLWDTREDLDYGSSTTVHLNCPETRCVSLDRDSESGEPVGDVVNVVGVVSADAQLDQSAAGGFDDAQLFAAIGGRKSGAVTGQPEFVIVPRGLFDVRHAYGDRC